MSEHKINELAFVEKFKINGRKGVASKSLPLSNIISKLNAVAKRNYTEKDFFILGNQSNTQSFVNVLKENFKKNYHKGSSVPYDGNTYKVLNCEIRDSRDDTGKSKIDLKIPLEIQINSNKDADIGSPWGDVNQSTGKENQFIYKYGLTKWEYNENNTTFNTSKRFSQYFRTLFLNIPNDAANRYYRNQLADLEEKIKNLRPRRESEFMIIKKIPDTIKQKVNDIKTAFMAKKVSQSKWFENAKASLEKIVNAIAKYNDEIKKMMVSWKIEIFITVESPDAWKDQRKKQINRQRITQKKKAEEIRLDFACDQISLGNVFSNINQNVSDIWSDFMNIAQNTLDDIKAKDRAKMKGGRRRRKKSRKKVKYSNRSVVKQQKRSKRKKRKSRKNKV